MCLLWAQLLNLSIFFILILNIFDRAIVSICAFSNRKRFAPSSLFSTKTKRDLDSFENINVQYDSEFWLALSNLEVTSPSKKCSQRVGCILLTVDNHEIVSFGTNTFLRHCGVHAELNTIVKHLKFPTTDVNTNMMMLVTFSPCIDCAQLIVMASFIRCVYYKFEYDEIGIDYLRQNGIETVKLNNSDMEIMQVRKKKHSYSLKSWTPNVTYASITSNDGSINENDQLYLELKKITPFDIRPFIMDALRLKSQRLTNVSSCLVLKFNGSLDHREKIFLDVSEISY